MRRGLLLKMMTALLGRSAATVQSVMVVGVPVQQIVKKPERKRIQMKKLSSRLNPWKPCCHSPAVCRPLTRQVALVLVRHKP